MPSLCPALLLYTFCFILLQAGYQLSGRKGMKLSERRWLLRGIPVAAAVPILFLPPAKAEPGGTELAKSFFVKWLDWANREIPDFTINSGDLLLLLFFTGFVWRLFKLVDNCWEANQFLQSAGNAAPRLRAWHGDPAACLGNLLVNRHQLDPLDRTAWAKKWLPIHPVHFAEAVLVEFFLALNWWNPAAHRYRAQWGVLYADLDTAKTETCLRRNQQLPALALFVPLYFCSAMAPLSQQLGGQLADFCSISIFVHDSQRPHRYTFRWGGQSVELEKIANPNGFAGELYTDLDGAKRLLDSPLQVSKDGLNLHLGTISIVYQSEKTGRRAYINDIDPKKIMLRERSSGNVLNDSLLPGDEFQIFGETSDIYLSRIRVKIEDPAADYDPPIKVPAIPQIEATSSFQVVGRQGQRALVKIDPAHPNGPRIAELYADQERYEIAWVPGFRTHRRYLTESDELRARFGATRKNLLADQSNIYYLPEFQDFTDKNIELRWGNMLADPSHDNYPLDTFRVFSQQEPQLFVGPDPVPIVAFDLIVAGKNHPPSCFRTDQVGHPSIAEALRNLGSESSVFFDQIVVRNLLGQPQLLPVSFSFNIGKDRPSPTNAAE